MEKRGLHRLAHANLPDKMLDQKLPWNLMEKGQNKKKCC